MSLFSTSLGVIKKGVALIAAAVLAATLAACSSTSANVQTKSGDSNVINVGVTSVLSHVNPLLSDASLFGDVILSLEYPALVAFSRDFGIAPQLATSIESDDNIHFTVKLDPEAKWSDGQPVTADDLVFTVLKLTSPVIANTSTGLTTLVGTGDDGFTEKGATSVEGVKKIDEHTVEFTTKTKIALSSFKNDYGTGIHVIPKHVIEKYDDAELAKTTIFNNPEVVSGPYSISKLDLKHYVQLKANDKYWKGKPKTENLNFKILTAAQILSGLQSGEIDVAPPTIGGVDPNDYSTLKSLKNVTVAPAKRVTHEMLFFNTEKITNKYLRRAVLTGIDRNKLLSGFVKENGEVTDGFTSTQSPIYDEREKATPYDQAKAKQLVEQAKAEGFDTSQQLTYYVSSSDSILTKAADYISAQLKNIGLNVQVKSVDLSTLISHANKRDYDLLSVQWTFFPLNPSSSVNSLITKTGWTGYDNPEITKAVQAVNDSKSDEDVKKAFYTIDTIVQDDVPAFSLFTLGSLGAVSNRVENVTADSYGTFLNVQDWQVKQ